MRFLIRVLLGLLVLGFVANLRGSLEADELLAIAVTPNENSTTGGIQEAIDALGKDGGAITLAPGEYLLRRSIRVRSNLRLEGAGEKTVLRKVKQAGSRLSAAADKEQRSVHVESAGGFQPGDEIGIYDQTSVGWEHVHAVVKDIRGNELLLDRRVGRALDPAHGAAVVNYFPAITATGVSRLVLRKLTIDGDVDQNAGPAVIAPRAVGKPPELGFTFAAINLVDVTDSLIEGCHVNGWPADGISLQRGSGNRVTNCVVENCRGEGFHPGGGLHDSQFQDLIARSNHSNGFYFCARVERVTVCDCSFIGNKKNGVGGLGDSGDTKNVVENNRCEANGQSGIQLVDGAGNTVKNNFCLNNSQSQPGRFSGIWLAATAGSVVSDNRCFDDQTAKTQRYGVEELRNSRDNTITNNDCRTNAAGGYVFQGQSGQQSGNRQ